MSLSDKFYLALAYIVYGIFALSDAVKRRRRGVNVEWVSVDSGARAISLASKESDVVFWSLVGDFNNWEKANEEDQPENTILTEPYLTGTEYYVIRDDSPLAEE